MRGAAPASAALSVLLCALCIASSRAGQPFGSFLLPDHGDEAGGYDVIVVGRNLGFFPSDMKVFVNGHSAKNIRVDVPWERARFTMPPCPKCGKALVTFKVGDERSQPLEYLFTSAWQQRGQQLPVCCRALLTPLRAQTPAWGPWCPLMSPCCLRHTRARRTAQVMRRGRQLRSGHGTHVHAPAVCIEVVALAQAVAPDQATYQGLKGALQHTHAHARQ